MAAVFRGEVVVGVQWMCACSWTRREPAHPIDPHRHNTTGGYGLLHWGIGLFYSEALWSHTPKPVRRVSEVMRVPHQMRPLPLQHPFGLAPLQGSLHFLWAALPGCQVCWHVVVAKQASKAENPGKRRCRIGNAVLAHLPPGRWIGTPPPGPALAVWSPWSQRPAVCLVCRPDVAARAAAMRAEWPNLRNGGNESTDQIQIATNAT